MEVAEAALALAALEALEATELTLDEPLAPVVVAEAEEDPEPVAVVLALSVAEAVPLPLPDVLEHPADAGWGGAEVPRSVDYGLNGEGKKGERGIQREGEERESKTYQKRARADRVTDAMGIGQGALLISGVAGVEDTAADAADELARLANTCWVQVAAGGESVDDTLSGTYHSSTQNCQSPTIA